VSGGRFVLRLRRITSSQSQTIRPRLAEKFNRLSRVHQRHRRQTSLPWH